MHVRLAHLDVVQTHHRVERDRSRRRRPCAPPGGAPGCSAARRRPGRPGSARSRTAGGPPASGRRRAKLSSAAESGERCPALEVTPCLAKSPSMTSTWQRPHRARPPHTESTSTPSVRAACSSGVPSAKRPRLPEGVKTTSASRLAHAGPEWPGGDDRPRAGRAPRPPGRPRRRRRRRCSAGASRKRLIQRAQSGSWPIMTSAPMQALTISTCSGFMIAEVSPGADRHAEEGRADALARRQPEAHVRGAAGGVDLELVLQAIEQAHHLHARPG